MTKFEINKTYKTRSICDHSWIIAAHIIRRTAKTVWLSDDDRTAHDARGKTFRIRISDDVETIAPFGRYSMSPTVRASS